MYLESIEVQRSLGISPEEIIIPYYDIIYENGEFKYERKRFLLTKNSWDHLLRQGGRLSTEHDFFTRVLNEWRKEVKETTNHDQRRERHSDRVGVESRRRIQSEYKSREKYLEMAVIESMRRMGCTI